MLYVREDTPSKLIAVENSTEEFLQKYNQDTPSKLIAVENSTEEFLQKYNYGKKMKNKYDCFEVLTIQKRVKLIHTLNF